MNSWNPFAIIQARLGSKRLPGKVLEQVRPGVPSIAMQVWRMAHSKELKGACLAVPNRDTRLIRFCSRNEIRVFYDNAVNDDDVLTRYYLAAKYYDADPVVRVTGDCPLIDYGIIDGVIKLYRESKADYASNNLEASFPHGTDVEVFSFKALEEAHHEATHPYDREHVTEWIRRHQDRPYVLTNLRAPLDTMEPTQAAVLCAARLTLDYPEDLKLIREIFKAFPEPNYYVTIADVVRMLSARPELMRINEHRALEHAQNLDGRFEPMSVEMVEADKQQREAAARAEIDRMRGKH